MVVIGARAPDGDERVPSAFVTTVRPDERPGAAPDLVDVLEGAPGAHVRRTGGTGRAAWLQVRGASAHQVAVLLDDLPLDGGRGSAVDLGSVPAALIERAELLRGAAGAAYGSGAQGGVLRLITRPPRLGRLAEVRLRAGTVGSGRLDGALGWGDGGAGLLAVGQVSAAEGDFPYLDVNGNRRLRQNNQSAQGGGLVKGHWDLADGHGRLFGLVEGLALERGEPGVEQFERTRSASARRRLQAAAGWRTPSTAPTQARLVAFGRIEAYAFDDPQPVFAGPTRFELQDTTVGATGRVARALGEHALSALGELRREAAHTETTGDPSTEPARDEARLRGALTAVDTWAVHPRLSLTGALRLDLNTERAAIVAPHGGLAWRLVGPLWLRGNLGRLFRDPGFDERYFVGQGVRGDPGLRAEDGWGADLGLQWAARRVSAELVGFAQRYDRLILFAPLGAYRVQAQDRFAARVDGLEARVATEGRWGSVGVSWTGLRAHFDDALGAALPYRPAHRVDGQVAAWVGPARAFTRWTWRSRAYVDTFESRSVPAYGTVDLGVDGPLGQGFSAGAEIRNALDAQGQDTAQQPLPGRRLFLSLAWQG